MYNNNIIITSNPIHSNPFQSNQCFPSTDVTFDHREPDDDAIYVDPEKVGQLLRTKYKLEETDASLIGGTSADAKSKSTLAAAAAALSVVVDGSDGAQVSLGESAC